MIICAAIALESPFKTTHFIFRQSQVPSTVTFNKYVSFVILSYFLLSISQTAPEYFVVVLALEWCELLNEGPWWIVMNNLGARGKWLSIQSQS